MTLSSRLVLACVLLTLAACQQPPVASARAPQSRADAAARADCRAAVDRVYAAQNRVDLSRRDERDNPFAGSYVSGIVTRGLSSRYGRDNLESSCLNASGERSRAVDTGTAPTFSPTAR